MGGIPRASQGTLGGFLGCWRGVWWTREGGEAWWVPVWMFGEMVGGGRR